jgi:hypothetical protein
MCIFLILMTKFAAAIGARNPAPLKFWAFVTCSPACHVVISVKLRQVFGGFSIAAPATTA